MLDVSGVDGRFIRTPSMVTTANGPPICLSTKGFRSTPSTVHLQVDHGRLAGLQYWSCLSKRGFVLSSCGGNVDSGTAVESQTWLAKHIMSVEWQHQWELRD